MSNRVSAPPITTLHQLELPDPGVYYLGNGIPVYEINSGTQEVIKLEIVFNAGRAFEQKALAARATNDLLKEGTLHKDSYTIAEHFDFYGGTLVLPYHLDTSNIVIYSLTRHFAELLPIVAELLTCPSFPEKELKNFVRQNQQRLRVDLAKNDVIAYRKVTEYIFGSDHPYGYNSYPDSYKDINRKDLQDHFARCYTAENCHIFISGRTDSNTIRLLEKHLANAIPGGPKVEPRLQGYTDVPARIKLDHPNSVQTAIRIGSKLFNRKHSDYKGLYVLNTLLGGYFGSRLMANVREEKGYTYNIYSVLDTMQYDGCFYIATEVGDAFVDQTLKEIYREMELLRESLVTSVELEMVKNYLLGNFLGMLDGPFNVMDIIKGQILEGLPKQFFSDLVQTVNEMTPADIQKLAKQYLQPEQMWEVVVGN